MFVKWAEFSSVMSMNSEIHTRFIKLEAVVSQCRHPVSIFDVWIPQEAPAVSLFSTRVNDTLCIVSYGRTQLSVQKQTELEISNNEKSEEKRILHPPKLRYKNTISNITAM